MCDISSPKVIDPGSGRKGHSSTGMASATATESLLGLRSVLHIHGQSQLRHATPDYPRATLRGKPRRRQQDGGSYGLPKTRRNRELTEFAALSYFDSKDRRRARDFGSSSLIPSPRNPQTEPG